MGKYVLFFFVIPGVLLLPAGCSNKEPAEPAAATEDVIAAAEVPEVPASAGSGYALRVRMWLYTFEGKDTGTGTDVLLATEPLSLGENLQLTAAETRKATNPYDREVYDYYQVRRVTGSTGLVFASQLTLGGALAVVTDEIANLYRTPRSVDASDYILPRKTVLGVFPETEKDGFIRIEAYDPVSGVPRRNLFVRTSAISYADVDVQSSILLQTAEALEDREKNRRQALLDSALNDYPGSIFADDIRALVPAGSDSSVRKTDGFFLVIDDNVNVREGPSASSPVITRLAYDVEVHVVEETVDEFTVAGQTARWFHITEPVGGWIFGAWLEALR
jgi:hypothetical protein